MNPVVGVIEEIYLEEGIPKARIRVNGQSAGVPLYLIMNARVGDEVKVEAGLALSRVQRSVCQ